MYKSFKFVLFNKSFRNPAKFQIQPNFGRSRISAGFVKKAGFRPEPEPNSGTALGKRKGNLTHSSFANLRALQIWYAGGHGQPATSPRVTWAATATSKMAAGISVTIRAR